MNACGRLVELRESTSLYEHIGGTLFCPDLEGSWALARANILVARLR
jgi:hypothetical protein